MYVTTFYSFKGGVGRTQALVNVGFELARTGRRVLLVDFDLEAPGLDTYALEPHRANTPGVLDFVCDYVESGEAPDASRYLYTALAVADTGGELSVMPAGRRHGTYASRLFSVDWRKIYDEHQGFFLLEDLRLQWKENLHFDYVLVDSRTGYSDVAGICTRQLPDAVVFMFFPNEQNLVGLPKIVDDVRREREMPRGRDIALHFVMANVPDIDDEDQIIPTRLDDFRRNLRFEALAATIHHYDSLKLVNQSIFTKDRPKTRLALEYVSLAQRIVTDNVEDKQGALAYLDALQRRMVHLDRPERRKTDVRLARIRDEHSDDPVILTKVASLYGRVGRYAEATLLLDRVIEAGHATAEALIRRAEYSAARGSVAAAMDDAFAVLSRADARDLDVNRAIQILSENGRSDLLAGVGNCPAVVAQDADSQLWLAEELDRSASELAAATEIYERLLTSGDTGVDRDDVQGSLAMSLIGLGECRKARDVLNRIEADEMDEDERIRYTFNSAMATWGARMAPERSSFQRVADLHASLDERDDVNYQQCMAVTFAVLGDKDRSEYYLKSAEKSLSRQPLPTVSCWRFMRVPAAELLQDLTEIAALNSGESRSPLFTRASVVD
jgi:cellulose biosynthesis protein BcsQ